VLAAWKAAGGENGGCGTRLEVVIPGEDLIDDAVREKIEAADVRVVVAHLRQGGGMVNTACVTT
jgi:hypothetical protein